MIEVKFTTTGRAEASSIEQRPVLKSISNLPRWPQIPERSQYTRPTKDAGTKLPLSNPCLLKEVEQACQLATKIFPREKNALSTTNGCEKNPPPRIPRAKTPSPPRGGKKILHSRPQDEHRQRRVPATRLSPQWGKTQRKLLRPGPTSPQLAANIVRPAIPAPITSNDCSASRSDGVKAVFAGRRQKQNPQLVGNIHGGGLQSLAIPYPFLRIPSGKEFRKETHGNQPSQARPHAFPPRSKPVYSRRLQNQAKAIPKALSKLHGCYDRHGSVQSLQSSMPPCSRCGGHQCRRQWRLSETCWLAKLVETPKKEGHVYRLPNFS